MANLMQQEEVDSTDRDALGRKKSFGHTGPKSTTGKNRAKMNALKHARNAKTKILPYEDSYEYDQLLKELYEDINPQGAVEADLVNQYIDSRWRSRRMEERIRIEQESIFERLDKAKIAAMLELDDKFINHLPDYLLDMSKRFGPKQIEAADIAWRQFVNMMRDYKSGEFTDLEEMRIHFDVLFEEFEKWIPHKKGLPPLLLPQRDQFNPDWIDEGGEFLFSVIQDFAIEMYFQANFMDWKEQIRNWMQIWYLMQKRELREIDQYDLVLIKEVHMQHAIIERLVKIQKYKRDSLLALQKQCQQFDGKGG